MSTAKTYISERMLNAGMLQKMFSLLIYLFIADFGPDGFPLGGAMPLSRKNPGSKSGPN